MTVAIIGAGAMGRLLATDLIQRGEQVTLFDRHPFSQPKSAAFASAGMLCPLGEIIHSPNVVTEMGWQSLERWPGIVQNLQALDTNNEAIFFQQQGSIATALPQDAHVLEQLQQDLSLKIPATDTVKELDRAELQNVEPSLINFDRGFLLESEGQLCNRQFIRVTNRILKNRLHAFKQQPIDTNDLKHLKHSFDAVFDCRGSGAINAQNNSAEKPLRGIRGEVIRVHSNEVSLTRPIRIVHPRNSIYVVPKPNHEFVIGATEIESNSDTPITVKSTLELLSTLYCVHPAFGEATVLETRAGVRAAYDDNIPRVHKEDNIITANGCYRHGWLVGPALVQQAIGLWEAA